MSQNTVLMMPPGSDSGVSCLSCHGTGALPGLCTSCSGAGYVVGHLCRACEGTRSCRAGVHREFRSRVDTVVAAGYPA